MRGVKRLDVSRNAKARATRALLMLHARKIDDSPNKKTTRASRELPKHPSRAREVDGRIGEANQGRGGCLRLLRGWRGKRDGTDVGVLLLVCAPLLRAGLRRP